MRILAILRVKMDDAAVGMGAIDHVFVQAGGGCSVRARTALSAPDDASGLHPSDHMAVVADVNLN